jgi:hypothetical protein
MLGGCASPWPGFLICTNPMVCSLSLTYSASQQPTWLTTLSFLNHILPRHLPHPVSSHFIDHTLLLPLLASLQCWSVLGPPLLPLAPLTASFGLLVLTISQPLIFPSSPGPQTRAAYLTSLLRCVQAPLYVGQLATGHFI